MGRLATVYYGISISLKEKYGDSPTFQIFGRAYGDHFKEVGAGDAILIQVRPSQELGCHTLQSPGDPDATFKKKREEKYQGYSALGIEACGPENGLNLITHLNVHPNQAGDAAVLAEDLDGMVKKTPGLKECHVDGGFGPQAVDSKAGQHQVAIIQTAVKGNTAKAPIEVQGNDEIGFTVTCPNPEQPPVKAIKLRACLELKFCIYSILFSIILEFAKNTQATELSTVLS